MSAETEGAAKLADEYWLNAYEDGVHLDDETETMGYLELAESVYRTGVRRLTWLDRHSPEDPRIMRVEQALRGLARAMEHNRQTATGYIEDMQPVSNQ